MSDGPLGSLIKIDFDIGHIFEVVMDSFKQDRSQKAEVRKVPLSKLLDSLSAISDVITQLDNVFLQLVGGFADREIVLAPNVLEEHIKASEEFLKARVILPQLEELMGSIEVAAYSKEMMVRTSPTMIGTLQELHIALRDYRDWLNASSGTLTPAPLIELVQLAREKNPAVATKAQRILGEHNLGKSGRIASLIGRLKTHLAIAGLSAKEDDKPD